MSKYTNLLGFFAANEVVDDPTTTGGATYVKAVIRDMKAYIRRHVDRIIPVGYSAADVESNRMEIAHYMNCGDESERAEFHGVNDYSWCGLSSFTTSGWDQKVRNFTDYSIPIFLSEYGCNAVEGARPFNEVETLYSRLMTPVFSGGLVYEFTQEPNDYGIVEYETLDDEELTKLDDFDSLKERFAKTPNPSGDGGYKEDGEPSECPEKSDLWEAENDLPPMPSAASKYLQNGAGEPRGTDGPSNMWIPEDGGEAPSDTGSAPEPTGDNNGDDNNDDDEGAAARVQMGIFAAAAMGAATLFGGLLL